MKKIRFGLLPRVIAAIALGVALGGVMPVWGVRIFVTFNALFGQFLDFAIPLIIVGLVAPAIADIGRGAGRLLLLTTLLAYTASIAAGFASYFTGEALFPTLISSHIEVETAAEATGLAPYFTVQIPPVMGVMTALVLAFMLGLGMAHLHGDTMRRVAVEFRDIVTMTIETVILPLLPIYIFGIFANMTASGEAFRVLGVFIKIIGVIFALHVVWLLALYGVAGIVARRNPLRMIACQHTLRPSAHNHPPPQYP